MKILTLEADNISKAFSDRLIFDKLSFEVKKGEVLSIVGPSGSGKSTLLRTLAGLEPLSGGSIWTEGRDITKLKANRRPISLVFQEPLLFPHMNTFENVAYGAGLKGKLDKKKIDSLLKAVELEEHAAHYPHELSGGQKQRAALARALAVDPALVLLDEPFSSLDPKLRKQLRYWVRDFLKEQQMTAVFVTHDHEEALLMGDCVAVFHEGRFQQIGTPREINRRPANAFVARFLGSHLVLDDERCLPLSDCKVRKKTSSPEAGFTMEGTVHHATYHLGRKLGHIHLPAFKEYVTLPMEENINEEDAVSIAASEGAIIHFDYNRPS